MGDGDIMIYQYTVSKLAPMRQTVPQIFRKAKYPEMKHQYFTEKNWPSTHFFIFL